MEILKIENDKGYYYSFTEKDYKEIDTIDKDSLLSIINYVLNNDDATTIAIDDTHKIDNKAQNIIYKSVNEKITSLIEQKQDIISNISKKYKEAFEKYS